MVFDDMSSIPVFRLDNNHKHLIDITEKCRDITLKFQEKFLYYPNFIVSSPGRVNIIGEHIDYEEFSVLPMAINRNILCAVKVLEDSRLMTIYDDNYEKLAEKKFELPINGELISIDPSVSDWSNYFKCGLLAAQKFLKRKFPDQFSDKTLKGLQVYIKGDIPTESGLSSSAAICVTVAILIIRSNLGIDYQILKNELIEITENAEHYIGVNSGSMDPTVIICNEYNKLTFINFKPSLHTTNIELPIFKHESIKFLIANTLVVSNKYETGPVNYNLRVVEDTVAANVLAAKYGFQLNTQQRHENFTFSNDEYDISTTFSNPNHETFRKGNLRDFLDAYFSRYSETEEEHEKFINPQDLESINRTKKMLAKMIDLLDDCFPNDKNQHEIGYSIQEITSFLNCSREEFTREYLLINPVRFQLLKLYQRAKHVFTEALRVIQSIELINFHQEHSDEKQFLLKFGEIMNQSQLSCDKYYECSCPEINEICKIARENGSYGSRLTGAGWGGCTVHLVSNNQDINKIKNALIQDYYLKHHPNITSQELQQALLVSIPSMGSCIFEL